MTRTIPLTRGQVAMVDDEDFAELSKYKWLLRNGYAARFVSVNEVRSGTPSSGYMHREIMQPPKGMVVDHINGVTLDNRRSNLRVCTNKQNCRNRGLPKNNKSGYLGVSYDQQNQKWTAQTEDSGKRIYLGQYSTKEEAAKVRDEYISSEYGEFAVLNSDIKDLK